MFPDILRSFPVLSVLQHDPPAAMKAFCDLSQSIIWRLFWHFFSKKELNYIVGSSRDDRAESNMQSGKEDWLFRWNTWRTARPHSLAHF
jgi:hypothetical protein